MQPLVFNALKFATLKHGKQKRRGGMPYISHPVAVANILRDFGLSEDNYPEFFAASYLHDVVEDTDTTIEEIEKRFGALVASWVAELTYDPNKYANKDEYIMHFERASVGACLIKLADRLHNLSDNPKNPIEYSRQAGLLICAVLSNEIAFTDSIYDKLNRIRIKLCESITEQCIRILKAHQADQAA